MKRVALLVLALLMLLTALPMSGVFADNDAATKTEALPEYFTLVGTKHLPPISNQGAIGSCASSSITYMQFTNAVSRYLHSINPDIEWDPSSGNEKYIFSPKYTYNFAGSGTEWVYRILMENGCLTLEDSHFLTDANGAYMEKVEDKVSTQTSSWDVGEGLMEKALNYRFSNFEQIWLRNTNDSYGVNNKVQITTTEKGQALIQKIKQSLIDGNVVVTGGLSGCWAGGYAYNAIVSKTELANKYDTVMYCGRGSWSGGHQVCIVGYDDTIEALVPNKNGGKTLLKGAFLMANSWGTGWENDGYIWIMYDALNEVSPYEELNFDDRKYPMDQFCFTDWRTDVVANEKPALYLEVGVAAGNRNDLKIELVSRALGATKGTFRKYTPYVFEYKIHQGDFADSHDYNFAGEAYKNSGSKSSIGYFTFPIGQEVTLGRYTSLQYGISVTSENSDKVTVLSLKLKNAKGEVLSSVTVSDGVVEGKSTKEFFVEAIKLMNLGNLPTVEGATVTPITGTHFVKEGADVSFKVTPDSVDKVAKVTVDGTVLEADADGVYTIKGKTNDTKVEIELVDAPTPAKENKGGSNMTIVIIAVAGVCAVAVIGGAVVLLGKKKKKA